MRRTHHAELKLEPFSVFAIAAITILAATMGTGAIRRHSKDKAYRQRILHRVAETLPNARVEPFNWVHESSIHYHTDDYSLDLRFESATHQKPPEKTVVTVRMNTPLPQLKLVPHATIFANVVTSLGSQDIEVGFAPFDEDYRIQGTNPQTIPTLFTPEVQYLISEMGDVLSLEMNSKRFQIEIHSTFVEAEPIQKFIQQVLECQHLMQPSIFSRFGTSRKRMV